MRSFRAHLHGLCFSQLSHQGETRCRLTLSSTRTISDRHHKETVGFWYVAGECFPIWRARPIPFRKRGQYELDMKGAAMHASFDASGY